MSRVKPLSAEERLEVLAATADPSTLATIAAYIDALEAEVARLRRFEEFARPYGIYDEASE